MWAWVRTQLVYHSLPSPHTNMAEFYHSADFVSFYEKFEVVDSKKKISVAKVPSSVACLPHRSYEMMVETHLGIAKAQRPSLFDMGQRNP
jgi:hypothetical protein